MNMPTRTRRGAPGWLPAALALLVLAAPAGARAQQNPRPPARDTARAARRDTARAPAPVRTDSARMPAAGKRDSARAAARPDSARQRPEPVTLPSVTLVVGPPPPSPWTPFAWRSLGYGGAAGFGLLLTTFRKSAHAEVCTGPPAEQDCVVRTTVTRPAATLGTVVAIAAVAAGLGDAALTWRRVHAVAQRAHLGLLPPTIEPDGSGARLTLVRWRF